MRLFVTLLFPATSASLAMAQTWNETVDGGGDAADLPATAQLVVGSGPLTDITGDLPCMAEPYPHVDMYKICIHDPAGFMASTSPGHGGSAAWDTALWLFDENGLGILANNDDSAGGTTSFIAPPADDGTGQTIPGRGVYYLAISEGIAPNDPSSGAGLIFNLATLTEISGPDGPGGGAAITGWAGPCYTGGAYQIHLNGASFVKPDGSCADVPAVSEWGLIVMLVLVLTAGTIVIGRRRVTAA